MTDEPDNLTLRVLREMREEMKLGFRDLRDEMDRRFDEVDRRFEAVDRRFEEVDRRFDNVHQRIDETNHVVIESRDTLLRVVEAVTAIAKVQEQHSKLLIAQKTDVEQIKETTSILEARLVRMEKHVGLVKI